MYTVFSLCDTFLYGINQLLVLRMTAHDIDATRVQWPQAPAVKEALRGTIRVLQRQGYRYFGTMTLPCLNGTNDADADPLGPSGWKYITFFHDCPPEMVSDEMATFPDIKLYARKDPPSD